MQAPESIHGDTIFHRNAVAGITVKHPRRVTIRPAAVKEDPAELDIGGVHRPDVLFFGGDEGLHAQIIDGDIVFIVKGYEVQQLALTVKPHLFPFHTPQSEIGNRQIEFLAVTAFTQSDGIPGGNGFQGTRDGFERRFLCSGSFVGTFDRDKEFLWRRIFQSNTLFAVRYLHIGFGIRL